MKIAGFDPSTKSTGKCIMELNDETFAIESVKLYAYLQVKKRCYSDDLLEITHVGSTYESKSILERQSIAYPVLDKNMEDVKFASFEGYAYSKARGRGGNTQSHSRGIIQLGEFIGSMKYHFYQKGIGVVVYPSTTIKKFATGDGTADKILMQQQFKTDYPEYYHDYLDNIIDFENPSSDIVDAFWLCEALRLHIKMDVLGETAMSAIELTSLCAHTAKSSAIYETPVLKL